MIHERYLSFILGMFCLLVLNSKALAQDEIDDSQASSSVSMYTDAVHWYGFDYSLLRVYDYTLIGREDYVIKSLCPSLTGYFKQRIPLDRFVKWFKIWRSQKTTVVDCSSQFFNSAQKLKPDSLVSIDGTRIISGYQLKEHLVNYELDESNGLGFVVLVESIGRKKEGVNLLGIFFDIKTREMLYAVRIKQTPTDLEPIKGYGTAIFRGVREVISKVSDKYNR